LCKVAAIDRDTRTVASNSGKRCHGGRIALDSVDSAASPRQRKGEGAEPGEQVERRAALAETGRHLLDQNFFRRRARLQERPGWVGYGNPRHQHADRAALDDRYVVAA
jgi:hypothetical protein